MSGKKIRRNKEENNCHCRCMTQLQGSEEWRAPMWKLWNRWPQRRGDSFLVLSSGGFLSFLSQEKFLRDIPKAINCRIVKQVNFKYGPTKPKLFLYCVSTLYIEWYTCVGHSALYTVSVLGREEGYTLRPRELLKAEGYIWPYIPSWVLIRTLYHFNNH